MSSTGMYAETRDADGKSELIHGPFNDGTHEAQHASDVSVPRYAAGGELLGKAARLAHAAPPDSVRHSSTEAGAMISLGDVKRFGAAAIYMRATLGKRYPRL